jgi:hypothetical protein
MPADLVAIAALAALAALAPADRRLAPTPGHAPLRRPLRAQPPPPHRLRLTARWLALAVRR